jgi:hypothetical protein
MERATNRSLFVMKGVTCRDSEASMILRENLSDVLVGQELSLVELRDQSSPVSQRLD